MKFAVHTDEFINFTNFRIYYSNKLTNQMQQSIQFITWRYLELNMFRA